MKFKFNIPNKITIVRIALIPLFAAILLADLPQKNILAAFIFSMLSISDFLDGYFARKNNHVTEFGKLIDPIADKLLISTALIFLVGKGVDLWMAVAIIARELVITAIRMCLLPGKIAVPVSSLGKAKTAVQSIAIVLVLLKLPLSWYAMLAAVLLTLVSGAEYMVRIKQITRNEIINLPNLITLTRFLLIVPFAYYFLNSKIHIALLIFAIIALSDKLDGILARLMKQKTEIGSGFDSFADWTLIITTFALLVIKNYVNALWLALLVIPSLISGIIKITYAKRQKIVPVTLLARLNVGLTYITIASILINFEYNVYLLSATLVMAYLTMVGYIFKAAGMPAKPASKSKKAATA